MINKILNFFLNFEGGGFLDSFLRVIFIYLFILWVAIVIWVARDIVSRSRNLFFQVFVILLVIGLNIFGLFIYLIIRPPQTLLEGYQVDLEQKALTEEEVCVNCNRSLPLEFKFCPYCQEQTRKTCLKCKKLMSKNWQICAYCGHKIKNQLKEVKPKA